MKARIKSALVTFVVGFLLLTATGRLADAEIAGSLINPGRGPGASIDPSHAVIRFDQIDYNSVDVTIVNSSTVIPSTRPLAIIVSAPMSPVTLVGTQIASGVDGQLLTIINRSNRNFSLTNDTRVTFNTQQPTFLMYGGYSAISFIYLLAQDRWVQTNARDVSVGQFTNIGYAVTQVTIANATSTIPCTTPTAVIVSAPAGTTTLTSNPSIPGGSVDGQQLEILNASGNTVILTNGNGVVLPAATLTLGQSAKFTYSAAFGFWVMASSSEAFLSADSTGVLTVPNGGTGAVTFNPHGVAITEGTGSMVSIAGIDGQFLVGVGGADPAFVTMSGDATTSNTGVITIAAGAVNLTTDVTGILPAANGGLGAGALQGTWSAEALTALADNANFTGPFKSINFAGKVRTLSGSWSTPGVGAGNVVMQIYDTTSAAALCSCTLGACTTAANVPLTCDCNSGVMTAGHVYTMQYAAGTNCAVSSPANAIVAAELVSP